MENILKLAEITQGFKVINGNRHKELPSQEIDLSMALSDMGLSALGLAVTPYNTGLYDDMLGRMANQDVAKHLTQVLQNLVNKKLRNIPICASWVFERHYNGTPHIHAIVFFPSSKISLVECVSQIECGKKSTTKSKLSMRYLLKQWANKKESIYPSIKVNGLMRKTASKRDDSGNIRRYVCDSIKSVQEHKQIRFLTNTKMTKYPRVMNNIIELMSWCEGFHKQAYGRKDKKKSARIDSDTDPLQPVISDIIINPNKIKSATRLKRFTDYKLLDLKLKAKNGEIFHAKRAKIYVNQNETEQIRSIAKTLLDKQAIQRYIGSLVRIKRNRASLDNLEYDFYELIKSDEEDLELSNQLSLSDLLPFFYDTR